MIKRFTKKPAEFDAIQFLNGDGPNTIGLCLAFCSDVMSVETGSGCFLLVGDDRCDDGQWIVRDGLGNFEVWGNSKFSTSFQEVAS